MAENKKWSQKALITSIDNTTEFCVLHGNSPIDNRRINAATLLATKAPATNPSGGGPNYAPKENPTFTGTVTLPSTTPTPNTYQAATTKYVDSIRLTDELTIDYWQENQPSDTTIGKYWFNPTGNVLKKYFNPILGWYSELSYLNANTIYIFNGDRHIWNGTEMIVLSKVSDKAPINNPTFTGVVDMDIASSVLVPNGFFPNSAVNKTQLDLKENLFSSIYSAQTLIYIGTSDGQPSAAANSGKYAIIDGKICLANAMMGGSWSIIEQINTNTIYPCNNINYVFDDIDTFRILKYALTDNPTFTGTVTLPSTTPTPNTYQAATTKYVDAAIDSIGNGTNYLMVYGVGTPAENAVELQAAYDAAKNMPRYLGTITSGTVTRVYGGQTWNVGAVYYKSTAVIGNGSNLPIEIQPSTIITEAEAKSTRTTVIVAPGDYTFGVSKFILDSSGINVVSLTGSADVKLDGINVASDYVFIKGIDFSTDVSSSLGSNLINFVCENCKGMLTADPILSGTYNSCSVDFSSADDDYRGIFTNCKITTGNWSSFTITNGGKIINCINADGSVYSNVAIVTPIFGSIPTSSAGLTTGMIWSNSGVLTIVS